MYGETDCSSSAAPATPLHYVSLKLGLNSRTSTLTLATLSLFTLTIMHSDMQCMMNGVLITVKAGHFSLLMDANLAAQQKGRVHHPAAIHGSNVAL